MMVYNENGEIMIIGFLKKETNQGNGITMRTENLFVQKTLIS